MRDLITEPLWDAAGLGRPIPDSPHAVSVCLPRWADVVGYEEQDPEVIGRMECGYPRFFLHPAVVRLFDAAAAHLGCDPEKEFCLVFPNREAAARCLEFVEVKTGLAGRLADLPWAGTVAVRLPREGREASLRYWRFSGEGVSSRLADWCLRQEQDAESVAVDQSIEEAGREARRQIRRRIAEFAGQRAEDVYLFPSGMASVFTVHRMLQDLAPGRRCAQVDFPYVDVLKVQQEFGAGVHFYPVVNKGGVEEIRDLVAREPLSGIYCELASNPLLRSVDVLGIRQLVEGREIPVIVDDTVGCVVNIDAFRAADVVTTSLTKYFSGTSDVMAGSIVLRSDSPLRERFRAFLDRETREHDLWAQDAIALEKNSRDFVERVHRINRSAEVLYDFLSVQPKVDRLWYPKNQKPEIYTQIHRDGGGYGGLMSILLKDPERTSAPFYDALRLSKGPSLGANFTLVCPYTLLAHYHELGWAADCGVDRHLIRISVGLEDPDTLIAAFRDALAVC